MILNRVADEEGDESGAGGNSDESGADIGAMNHDHDHDHDHDAATRGTSRTTSRTGDSTHSARASNDPGGYPGHREHNGPSKSKGSFSHGCSEGPAAAAAAAAAASPSGSVRGRSNSSGPNSESEDVDGSGSGSGSVCKDGKMGHAQAKTEVSKVPGISMPMAGDDEGGERSEQAGGEDGSGGAGSSGSAGLGTKGILTPEEERVVAGIVRRRTTWEGVDNGVDEVDLTDVDVGALQSRRSRAGPSITVGEGQSTQRHAQGTDRAPHAIGRLFRHRKYGYRAIIVGWDPRCG